MKKMRNRWMAMGMAGVLLLSGCVQAEGSEQREDAAEGQTTNLFTEWLPAGVTPVLAETEPNEAVREALIGYYDIPEEAWKDTKYYYDFVDLDRDGEEEVFVVAMGSYVSGSGGSSALWLDPADGFIRQAFTLVNTPIIVTDEVVNGYQTLVLQRSGGGAETEAVMLTNTDGIYTNVADAAPLENLQEMQGTAILSNDLIAEGEAGTALTLAD